MAISTLSGIYSGLLPPVNFHKASATSEGADRWHSLWKVSGFPLTAGSNPPAFNAGSGYTCDKSTAGALPFVNPASGNTYLAKFGVCSNSVGTLVLYDRLWTCSGLVTNSVLSQTITTPGSLPSRDSTGATTGYGVELWGEVYTAPGATGATWTVTYTNQASGGSNSANYIHPANAETANQMFPFTLAGGDTGVQSVQSFVCSISSGTAGSIGLTLLRRIAEIPIPVAGVYTALDALTLGFPRIYDSSCLALMVRCSSTSSGNIFGNLVYAQG